MFKRNSQRFSLGLIRWCCGITEHLETVIIDQPISYIDVAALIQSCSNLKNFQIGRDEALECLDGGKFSSLKLPFKNSTFISRCSV